MSSSDISNRSLPNTYYTSAFRYSARAVFNAAPPPLPPPNKWFQTAVLDPAMKMVTMPNPPPKAQPDPSTKTRSAPPKPQPRLLPLPEARTDILSLTIGTAPTQRTWLLSKSLLVKHSAYLALLIASDLKGTTMRIEDVEARAFANFADYMHSSIYSPNRRVENFRSLGTHVEAVVLGARLGAREYVKLAMAQLHTLFKLGGELGKIRKDSGLVKASDMAWICQITATSPDPLRHSFYNNLRPSKATNQYCTDALAQLRKLFFDAVASHWTRRQVVNLINELDFDGDTVTWSQVFEKYRPFRDAMRRTSTLIDVRRRVELLRPMQEYLIRRSEDRSGDETEEDDGEQVAKEGLQMRRTESRRPGGR